VLATLTKRFRLLTDLLVSGLAFGVLLASLPFTAITAISSTAGMSCCVEGSGHCDSGMMSKKAPPPEPMCGLDAAGGIDEITIVAKTSEASKENSSHDSSQPSFTAPCSTDCCSQVWAGYRKPNRDFSYVIQRSAFQHKPRKLFSGHPSSTHLFTSTHFNKSIPRGPPSVEHT
jgi:hypothetical protein